MLVNRFTVLYCIFCGVAAPSMALCCKFLPGTVAGRRVCGMQRVHGRGMSLLDWVAMGAWLLMNVLLVWSVTEGVSNAGTRTWRTFTLTWLCSVSVAGSLLSWVVRIFGASECLEDAAAAITAVESLTLVHAMSYLFTFVYYTNGPETVLRLAPVAYLGALRYSLGVVYPRRRLVLRSLKVLLQTLCCWHRADQEGDMEKGLRDVKRRGSAVQQVAPESVAYEKGGSRSHPCVVS